MYGYLPAKNVLRLNERLTWEARVNVDIMLITAKNPLKNLKILEQFEGFSYEAMNITAALQHMESQIDNKGSLLDTLV